MLAVYLSCPSCFPSMLRRNLQNTSLNVADSTVFAQPYAQENIQPFIHSLSTHYIELLHNIRASTTTDLAMATSRNVSGASLPEQEALDVDASSCNTHDDAMIPTNVVSTQLSSIENNHNAAPFESVIELNTTASMPSPPSNSASNPANGKGRCGVRRYHGIRKGDQRYRREWNLAKSNHSYRRKILELEEDH